jgi:hypothetical protein
MKNVVVTEKAIRELIGSVLEGEQMAKVNQVVDPSAPVTDPMRPDFKPQNAAELNVAVQQMTKGLPGTDAPKIFDALKDALKPKDSKDQEKETMDTTTSTTSTTGTSGTTSEAALRRRVRYILREEFDAYDAAVKPKSKNFFDDDEEEKPAPEPDDARLADIAAEFGMSPSGAAALSEKILARLKFVDQQLPKGSNMGKGAWARRPQMERLIIKAWDEYIDILAQTDEITAADVQMMHDHPEVALDLPGFREFLHPFIHRAMNVKQYPDEHYQKVTKPFKPEYSWVEDDKEFKRTSKNALNHLSGELSSTKKGSTTSARPDFDDYLNNTPDPTTRDEWEKKYGIED